MQINANHYKKIIIGGGVSGLFLAKKLLSKGDNSFLLIEKSKKNLGGYALWGDIKIGMLPAGNLTATYFNLNKYEKLSKNFIEEYKGYLKLNPIAKDTNFNFPSNVVWKNYLSYIFSRESGKIFIESIFNIIDNNIYFSSVRNIINKDNRFFIHLDDNIILTCDKLIIATGRYDNIELILRNIGENFHETYTILAGFRAEFMPNSVHTISSAQLDFRIKSDNSCQTYCFNHKGQIKSYFFKGKRVFCGALDQTSETGNTFIGKKLLVNNDLVKDIINKEFIIEYKDFIAGSSTHSFSFVNDIREFMLTIEELGINFTKLYFPAMEQFWPKPILLDGSLQSQKIPNLYYVGDSTGISYGFLQCYITANILAEQVA